MRFDFALRVAISLLGVHSLPSMAQRAPASPDWRGVDRALEAFDSMPHADSLARVHRAWRRFDAAIAASLNAGSSPDSINRILAHRRGYEGPTAGDMTLRTAAATFWAELPRNTPTFYVAALDERSPQIIGVFQFPSFVNGPSAVSIYSRVAGTWRRTAGFMSDRRIAVYPIPPRGGARVIATLETWVRADGSEGELKLWRLQGDALRRVPRADTTKLQDPDVATTDSSVVFTVIQFPRVVDSCTMCTRLAEQHELMLDDGRVTERVNSLNPWVTNVERLFGELSRGQIAAARKLFADSAMVRPLVRHHAEPQFWADSGDFERGEGFAIVLVATPDNCPAEWRIVSKRQPDQTWRIVSAQPGLWDGDHRQFIARSLKKLPPICS